MVDVVKSKMEEMLVVSDMVGEVLMLGTRKIICAMVGSPTLIPLGFRQLGEALLKQRPLIFIP